MTDVYALLMIFLVAGLTFLTRYLPFALFGNLKRPSAALADLGQILPPAVIAILVVYCLKTVSFQASSSWIPQFAAVLAVALLHLWKRNNLLSIGAGTVFYMVLVQWIA